MLYVLKRRRECSVDHGILSGHDYCERSYTFQGESSSVPFKLQVSTRESNVCTLFNSVSSRLMQIAKHHLFSM